MEFLKATLTIEKEFPTVKCEECGVEFMLFGINRLRDIEYDFGQEERFHFFTQQSQNLYCPYCGKRGNG